MPRMTGGEAIVDSLLRQNGAFRANEELVERVVATQARDRVVAGTAGEGIAAASARQDVIAVTARQHRDERCR